MIAFLFLFVVSCKKDTDIQNGSQSNSSLTFGDLIPNPTALDIQNHIVWIAKGLPFLAQNTNFRYSVEESVGLSNLFEATNSNVHTDAWNNYSYHYQDSLHTALDNHVPSNLYDPDHFGGFYYNSCNWFFKIRIPEMDEQDTSLPHIVIPENFFQGDTATFYTGYFINNQHLDSVAISLDDFEDYYIWVVSVDDDCKLYKSGCENNGKCEDFESDLCEDCTGNNNVPGKMGTLILKSVISKRDWKDKNENNPLEDFEENWIKGKYELSFFYASISGSHVEKSNIYYLSSEPLEKKLSAWGNNCDVKRSRVKNNGSTVSNRGVENSYHSWNHILDYKFNSEIDSLYFMFYESDPNFGSAWGFPNKDSITIEVPHIDLQYSATGRMFRAAFSRYSDLTTTSQDLTIPSPVNSGTNNVLVLLPPGINSPYRNGWNVTGTTNGRDILECTVEMKEFSLVFEYVPNP